MLQHSIQCFENLQEIETFKMKELSFTLCAQKKPTAAPKNYICGIHNHIHIVFHLLKTLAPLSAFCTATCRANHDPSARPWARLCCQAVTFALYISGAYEKRCLLKATITINVDKNRGLCIINISICLQESF